MNRRLKRWPMIFMMLLLAAGSSMAQSDAELRKDLTSVIALLGLPCGEVVKVNRLGENDNLAVCKDGNRYRVFINEQGRVVAEKK